ncbi:MAG TPA: NAD-glutamate dehydrogenase, partial [Stellaceae bacterium]|nr:NAD-glutamate dehydrogenase [Stellaceae bacterium]
MTTQIEQDKAKRVRAAADLAKQRAAALPRRFIAELYEHVPPGDIAAHTPADLCGGAVALWRFAGRRIAGAAAVRVYNPDAATDGWASPHTVVEIVNDDMPFLVDSATAAINESGREIRLVIHPVLRVARDAAGALVEIDPPHGGASESWMQIPISREPDPNERAALASRLACVLAEVRHAVADWPAMRQQLQAVVAELAALPPPLPAAEIGEGSDFLRWLDDDNFTYLGCRDYAFVASPATAPPLGILADDSVRVFGGLRDLAALPRDVQNFVRRRELLIIAKTEQRARVHRAAYMDAIGVRRFDAAGDVVGLRLFLGLFTSTAYSRSPRAIPLLRQKVGRTMERAGLAPDSHDGKALAHILETFPRDELLQIGEDELFDTAIGILNLQERQRIALFVRRDPLERFVSCLVYVPRERYDTRLRQAFAAVLADAFAGTVTD